MKNLSIIVAIAKENAIGKDNDLLFYLPEDLKRFKALTTGHSVLMGRKTYDSLPNGALPNRRNIVITTQKELELPRCEVVHSVEAALELMKGEEEVFVIGGAEIYRQFFSHTNKLYLTKVEQSFEANTFFPIFDENEWEVVAKEEHYSEKNGFNYAYLDLVRKV